MATGLKYYFGIDFGTTNSATVGYVVMDQKPEAVKYGDEEGRPIPSVVAIDKTTGAVFTGRDAWDKKMELSESCEYISSVKTILDSEQIKTIAGREWTAVDVASEVFKYLKANVHNRTGIDMEEATVAIPVGFSASKRAKLREAAKKAGIHISSFISEPTAAFFANYNELKSSSVVAIFDWGGGTLDVSILQHVNGKVSELATVGRGIAGDYIDDKIAKRIHAKIARKKGVEKAFADMPSSAQDMMRVRAERAKRMLGDDDTATISINNYGVYGACRETLEYDWFADIVDPEVTMAMDCLEEAIRQSGVGLANIDRIVMVGGSSNLRPLLEKMNDKYGDKLFFPEETMWNVGQGAAMLAMTPGGYYANQSIGIVLSDNAYYEILKPDTPIRGWEHTCHFGIVDSSKEACFIFGGSPDIEAAPERYKTLTIPAYRFLQEQIILNASVDQNMRALFRECGYSTEFRPLNASDYGVLQNRKRIILIGIRGNYEGFYPDIPAIPNQYLVSEVFGDLPAIPAGGGTTEPVPTAHYDGQYLYESGIKEYDTEPVTFHQARPHTDQDLEIYRIVVDTWNKNGTRVSYIDLPANLRTHQNTTSFLDRFKVVAGNLPHAQTIVAHIARDGHYFIHPDIEQNRSITPREAARIQTFPDNYYFESKKGVPSRTLAFKQIGNAVPVCLAYHVATALLDRFDEQN